jgi:glycosyltransferase involved in cell wall biosynthesis
VGRERPDTDRSLSRRTFAPAGRRVKAPVLRIGVDAREVLGDTTGVGRYLSELLKRWVARQDGSTRQFVLFAPDRITLPLPPDRAITRVLPARHAGTWWEQSALRRAVSRERLDLFFAPAYTAPVRLEIPFALTIHDVSFLAHPEWFRPREGLRRRWLTRHSGRQARVVLTDSVFSRDEILKHIGVSRDRVRVVPPSHRRERLVLFVGTLLNRRRLPHLVDAFAVATADLPDARLAIVGADRTWPPEDLPGLATRLGIANRMDLRSYVNDTELAALYARASVFVFLSEYEGFGLTPLEALAAGLPIVVLDTPIAREVYGPAATYVPRSADVTDTAWIIRRILLDKAAAHEQMAVAPGVLARYSWDVAAASTLDALESCAGRR